MEDTLHYTFSTIPQVLSAMVALLGVFWVFKISDLNNKLKFGAEALRREVNSNDPAKRKYLSKLEDRLGEKVNRLPIRIDSAIHQENFKWIYNTICEINEEVKNDIVARVKREYEDINQEKSQLTADSKRVLILSGIQIVISVGFLTLVPLLDSIYFSPYIIMIPNLIFFAFIIVMAVRTITTTLKVQRLVD